MLEELNVRCAECGTRVEVVSVLIVQPNKAVLNVKPCPQCSRNEFERGYIYRFGEEPG